MCTSEFPMIPSELFFSQNPSLGSLKAFSVCFRSESWLFRSEFIWLCKNHNAGHIVIWVYFWPWNATRRWRNPTKLHVPTSPCMLAIILSETTVRTQFIKSRKLPILPTHLLSWNFLYIYTWGTLGCLLGFWPQPCGGKNSSQDQLKCNHKMY